VARGRKKAPAKKKVAKKKRVTKKKRAAKRGRPSKFDTGVCDQAVKLCMLGAIDKDLADFFGISESTLNKWKIDYPEFSESLKEGKAHADANVANSLYQRALGYSHAEEKIFCNKDGDVTRVETIKHYAPDTTACIFWLKNRRKDVWRDRHELTGADGDPVIVNITDPCRKKAESE
jgi:hypothetical protein